MKVIFPIALLVSAVMAQTPVCAADYIVETCLQNEKVALDSCLPTDYNCQCSVLGAYVTCFNNCPNDTSVSEWTAKQSSACQFASTSTSSTAKPTTLTTSGSTPAETSTASATSVGFSTGTSSGSASTATKSSGAADFVLNAGSVILAMAGVIAAVL